MVTVTCTYVIRSPFLSKMCQSPSLAVEHPSAFDSALAVHTACQLYHCSKDLSKQLVENLFLSGRG